MDIFSNCSNQYIVVGLKGNNMSKSLVIYLFTFFFSTYIADSISEHALLPQEDFVVDENDFSPSSSTEL